MTNDHRRSDRHSWTEGTRFIAALEDSPAAVSVRNISLGGISLVTDRSLIPGTAITVRLFDTIHGSVIRLPGRVIHAHEQPDGQFAVGAAFTQALTDQQLQALF